jgi:histidinol-phosphatase (PHP family)
MFDFHMHSTVSYDGHGSPLAMAQAAKAAGLKEICFTDHLDYMHVPLYGEMKFRVADYSRAYDDLQVEGLLIRNGTEVGMTPWNMDEIKYDLKQRHFDFVLGSVHFFDDTDPYMNEDVWKEHSQEWVERRYFEELLECVKLHDNFDVLGHLTYIAKVGANPNPRKIALKEYQELVDEILKILVAKGKGMEVNTSGMRRFGDYLPGEEYLRRFRELGGEIVTVGSDAHNTDRVGEYAFAVCDMLKDIFGHVCTFENRKPVFHKL